MPPGLTLIFLHSARKVYLCILYGPKNELRLLAYAPLTDWFFYNEDGVCLLLGTS